MSNGNSMLAQTPDQLSQLGVQLYIDRFSLFQGRGRIAGWAFAAGRAIEALSVQAGKDVIPIASYGLESADVAAAIGESAGHCRFDERFDCDQPGVTVENAGLIIARIGGESIIVPGLMPFSLVHHDAASDVMHRFFQLASARAGGRALEIGGRTRVSTSGSALIPPGWERVGLDIVAGANVDVVGDAHRLSHLFAPDYFDAVVSVAVFEHLLMPWKVVIEMNRVMKPGAIGYIMAPQSWPIHEEPWDYFRFSRHSWTALFNKATGFEIIGAAQGEPTHMVARIMSTSTNFDSQAFGYLASSVAFRKIANTTLDWPVELADIVASHYPL
jgi:SAM-dependent methyltransferase